jgi:hypothetical protein
MNRVPYKDRPKQCTGCKVSKPRSDFYSHAYTSSQGKRSTRWLSLCRICDSERRKQDYQIQRANPLKSAQITRDHTAACRKAAGLPAPTREEPVVCECCGRAPIKERLCLDHDHKTGVFRGWLCKTCNMAIGKLGDDLDGVERARAYLIRAEFT